MLGATVQEGALLKDAVAARAELLGDATATDSANGNNNLESHEVHDRKVGS